MILFIQTYFETVLSLYIGTFCFRDKIKQNVKQKCFHFLVKHIVDQHSSLCSYQLLKQLPVQKQNNNGTLSLTLFFKLLSMFLYFHYFNVSLYHTSYRFCVCLCFIHILLKICLIIIPNIIIIKLLPNKQEAWQKSVSFYPDRILPCYDVRLCV